MSIPSGTILKIAQNILLPDTQTAVNVFWVSLSEEGGVGPLEEADVLEAAGNWMDQIYANVTPDMADTVVSTIVEVWTVNEATKELTPVGDEATTWVGVDLADALPNGVAAIGSMKTTETEVTGRKFLPGFVETDFTDNNLGAGGLARLVLFVIDWATVYIDPNNVHFSPGVYSPTKLNFFFTTGVVIANAIAGYQRRRKPGVGS